MRFDHPVPLVLGPVSFDLSGRALIVGIVNRASDLSNGGIHESLASVVTAAERLAHAGVDIIDLGGVRSRLGPEIAVSEEVDRLASAVAAIVARTGRPVSVDTERAMVAKECFAAGAVLANDVSGFSDPEFLAVAASAGGSVVATHDGSWPRTADPQPFDSHADIVTVVETFLLERLARATEAGLGTDRVIFDVGLDLGKTTPESVALFGATGRFSSLGPSLLLSLSNSDFIGQLLGFPESRRSDANVAAIALGVTLGARVVRVDDPEAARRVCRTIEAVLAA